MSREAHDLDLPTSGQYAQAGTDLQAQELADRIATLAAPEAAKIMSSIAEQLRHEGREEGRQEGQQLTLLKQLRFSFQRIPEDALARINAASSSQLDVWAERVRTARRSKWSSRTDPPRAPRVRCRAPTSCPRSRARAGGGGATSAPREAPDDHARRARGT